MGVGSGGLYGAAHVRTGNLPTGHKEDRPEPPGNPGCTVVLRTPFLLIHSLILSFIPFFNAFLNATFGHFMVSLHLIS